MSDISQTSVVNINPLLPRRRRASFTDSAGSPLGLIGGLFEWFGRLGIFSWQVLKAAVTPPFEWRELIRQLDEVGSKSLPLVALAGAAIGVVISLEARYSLTRFGAKSLFPATLVYSVIQVMGPIITGLVVSGRVGAGIGAELASMKVTEQIDAIEASAVNPYRLLAATRILACILMLPLLTLAADACGLLTGWFAQSLVEHLSFHQFIESGFNGATSQCISSAHLQDSSVWTNHWTHCVFSGDAHTRRCRRSRSCCYQLSRTGFTLPHPGRCCFGEIHPRRLPLVPNHTREGKIWHRPMKLRLRQLIQSGTSVCPLLLRRICTRVSETRRF